ncbi:GntR family transcriptional regulator [Thermus thermamylovorans]|uniref:GntR family transcriptional regulator n=1 Tax=Thermus thermamylovorans TaxID=2509362 RepID=A0A4Q9B0A5_9DEIN|nr:GntR family transcriptional regulator [Thermus thermamylovorans]TBH17482.1 GntR family transcriptional regulator [Thermus thermamylovorans]
MQALGFRRPNQVREAVYRHLKDLLLSGRFAPGERLSEPLLAQELGVSRTPVREALMRLAEEGLVELVPGKGARVRAFSPEEVEEVYGVRALLEGEAAREAAQRATPWELTELEAYLKAIDEVAAEDYPEQMRRDLEFHRALVRLSGNKTLFRLYEDLLSSLALVRSALPTLSQEAATRREHWAILEALRRRDPEGAKRAVEAHVGRFRDLVVRRLKGGV